jgi:acetyl esterase/lipase
MTLELEILMARPSRLTMLSVLMLLHLGLTRSNLQAAEPQEVLLWPNGAPGAKGDQPEDKPSLTAYLPSSDKSHRAGIVVCPGGGYGRLAMGHEGVDVAQWLNSIGVAAFVLKYRLGPRYQHPAPSDDAKRAIRLVRTRAEEWGVDPARVGIMGFSAGGHLASTVATHFDPGKSDAGDPIERPSSRPDFAILGYPVISLVEPFAHAGSRRNLLGTNPDPMLVKSLSNETQVTRQTPPTFLMHTSGDTGVPPENSVAFYLALRKADVPAELHIYERGRHGLGLAPSDPALSSWPARAEAWLRVRGVLPEGQAAK